MTRETAERATQILIDIENLNKAHDNFIKSRFVQIQGMDEDGFVMFKTDCKKGLENGKIVKFILDGIDQEIKKLEEELKML